MVNASGEEVATSSSILSLPPAASLASSSPSTSSLNTVTSSATTKAASTTTSLGDLSKPIRFGHKKPPPQPPQSHPAPGDVKDSLKLLDDAINFYENDTTTSISSSTANLNFDAFSSSQGESTEDDDSESIDVIEYSSATLPSRRLMSGVKLSPLSNQSSPQINSSSRGYFSQQDIPSVEMSRSRLEERIEARIRRNRIRPTVRPSILLDNSNPDPSVFTRK